MTSDLLHTSPDGGSDGDALGGTPDSNIPDSNTPDRDTADRDTSDSGTEHAPRLTMKPDAALGGRVDGAWWPRSTDATAEFPALITALGAGGEIRRVAYHLGRWGGVGRTMEVGGTPVRMEGFHGTQPDTVTLIRADHTRIRLLVVPPRTPDGVARAVLRATSTASRVATVEDILSWNGVVAGTNPVHDVVPPRNRPLEVDEPGESEGGADRRSAFGPV